MIDQRFMDSLYSDMTLPPSEVDQAVEQGVLLAENKNISYPNEVMTDTGGGAMVGYRLNMPKHLTTPEEAMTRAKELPKAIAATAKGAAQGSVGLYGDLEGLARSLINISGGKVDETTLLPTTEKIKEYLDQYIPMGKENAPYEAVGEVASPAGVVGLGMKAAKPAMKILKESVELAKTAPMGLSIKSVGEGVDELGFYSAASKAVDAIGQDKGTGAQFLAQIQKTPGVKADELKWTGLDDFLAGKKSVTKSEVQEYLNANRVDIKEVTLGNPLTPSEQSEIKSLREKDRMTTSDRARFDVLSSKEDGGNAPKFAKYTLSGGENYREVLLTLPSKNPEFDPKDLGKLTELSNKTRTPSEDIEYKALAQRYDASLRGETSPEFKSQHFDQPNVLAHMRVNDRVDADGKKVLFVEEVQSDWHQAGRKKGYAEDVNKQLESINEQRSALMDEKLRYEKLAEPYTSQGKDAPAEIVDGWTMAANKLNELQTKQNRLGQGVPDAPFKTTWHELALKRAIQLATEGGYDRIAFTTGKTQAERYDLSKQVERITAIKNDKGIQILGIDTNGNSFDLGTKSIDELPSVIGKDLADKIAKQDTPNAQYAGKDLVVGGEGMKGFYDQILPKFLDKYAKKWDAKTGMTDIKADGASEGVQYLDITPKMKESVLTKGQPMFQVAPAIPAGVAATQQEEKK